MATQRRDRKSKIGTEPRFRLYSFTDVIGVSEEEWDEECDRNGVDRSPHEGEPVIVFGSEK